MKTTIIKKVLPLIVVALVGMALATSCEKENDKKCTFCNVDNPIIDLPWLNEIVVDFENTKEIHSSVSSCIFNENNEGFLICYCENCPDAGVELRNCNGDVLGVRYGLIGNPLSQYKIVEKSILLLYKNY